MLKSFKKNRKIENLLLHFLSCIPAHKHFCTLLWLIYGTAKSTDSEVLAVSVVHKSDANAAQSEATDLEFNNTRD